MNVVDPGHEYELACLDVQGQPFHQNLLFVKREGPGYPGNEGHHGGTTTQEVLRALIERGDYVNAQIPCAETEAATALMRTALLLLEQRAARRHDRHIEAEHLEGVESRATCTRCGHVGCSGHCH